LHSCPEGQVVQATPPVPHAPVLGVRQLPFASQQPLGHEFLSQTHLPCELHSWLDGHAWHVVPFRPHVAFDEVAHWPLALQQPPHILPPHVHEPPEHAWPLPQEPHAAPPLPHEVDDWAEYGSHVPLVVQQPCGHDVASQTHLPALHSCPDGHAEHATPPVPHAELPVVVTQCPFASQQPFGQVWASQTHSPCALHS
jgi:hypothetical protein